MAKNIALITAGGTGSRMNMSVPKQFVNVNDKPIIVYTLEQFQSHPLIDAIYVSCLEGWENVLEAYSAQFGITKLASIVSGGATGQESIHNALVAAAQDYDDSDFAIIHDGNRATVTHRIIFDAIETASRFGSSVTAIPCVEVVAKLSDSNVSDSCETVPRELLRRTQTPHVYKIGKLSEAHRKAKEFGYDCAATPELMCLLGERMHFCQGSSLNFKITEPDDIALFRAILKMREQHD